MAILAECPMCHRRQSIRSKRCMSKNGKGCGADLEKAKRSGKVKYWIAYRLPGGKQRFEKITGENATSVEYAKDAEAKRKVQKRENRIFDIKPEAKMTFQELTDWYLSLEKVKALASYMQVNVYLKKFNSEFGRVIIDQIKPADLENLQGKRKGEGFADATIDQEIGHARGVINKAFKNNLVGGDTLRIFQGVGKLLKRNANARDKIITLGQFKELMENLPPHISAVLVTAFYTGMRQGEIISLTWPQVDMKGRVIRLAAKNTKDREARTVPICEELYQVLDKLPRNPHDHHVFLNQGMPIAAQSIRGPLMAACRTAGIIYGRDVQDGFIFHDLRHCFNTYMRKAGVSESVIMRMTGHSSREMFDRYNRVDEEDMKIASIKMRDFLEGVDQTVDQTWN